MTATPSHQSVVDWSEYQDDISDAISDSIDMDWNANDGARAVVRWLNDNASMTAPQAEALALRTLLDNLVIAQCLSKEIREHATSAARSYLYNTRRAAPAPSSLAGGEVRQELIETLKRIEDGLHASLNDQADAILAALSPEAPARERDGTTERRLRWAIMQMREVLSRLQYSDNESDFEESRASGVAIGYAALTPRHEAPAEGAGEIGAEYDTAAHCLTLAECPPGLFLWNGSLGFKSEYGAMEPDDATNGKHWKVGNRADAYCADSGEYFWGGATNHDDRAKLLVYPIAAETVAMVASHGPAALRARSSAPEAREGEVVKCRANMDTVGDCSTRGGCYCPPQQRELRDVVKGIDADYMTSETHHPGYVLIPAAKFDAIVGALREEK